MGDYARDVQARRQGVESLLACYLVGRVGQGPVARCFQQGDQCFPLGGWSDPERDIVSEEQSRGVCCREGGSSRVAEESCTAGCAGYAPLQDRE